MLGAEGEHDEDRQRADEARELDDDVDGCDVAPVEIVEDEDPHAAGDVPLGDVAHQAHDVVALDLGRGPGPLAHVRHREQLAERRERVPALRLGPRSEGRRDGATARAASAVAVRELRTHRGDVLTFARVAHLEDVGLQQVVGLRPGERLAAALAPVVHLFQPRGAPVRSQLAEQPALAQARLADDRDGRTLSAAGRHRGLAQRAELSVPTDERRAPALGTVGMRGFDATGHFVRRGRGRSPFQGEVAERAEGERARDEALRRFRNDDRSRRRRGLEPRCHVHDVPERRVLDGRPGADVAQDDKAGVDAEPRVETGEPGVRKRFAVPVDRVDHLERREDGALRIVLVGRRGAEIREDRVAEHACDRAVVARDRRHQRRERAAHDVGPLFGIAALREGRRAGDVAEDDGADPALPQGPIHLPPAATSPRPGAYERWRRRSRRDGHNVTIVAPSPPSLPAAGACARTSGCAERASRTAFRSAPVPFPCTTRTRSYPATAALLR